MRTANKAAQQSCWLPSPQHASTKVPKQRLLLDFEPRHQHGFKLCCARTVSLINHSSTLHQTTAFILLFRCDQPKISASMGFWNCLKADSKRVKPKAEADDTPHSLVCNKFNRLSPKQTNYIDRERLEQALGTIFRAHGTNLDFGLKVCKRGRVAMLRSLLTVKETRSERWTFWAPEEVEWVSVKSDVKYEDDPAK